MTPLLTAPVANAAVAQPTTARVAPVSNATVAQPTAAPVAPAAPAATQSTVAQAQPATVPTKDRIQYAQPGECKYHWNDQVENKIPIMINSSFPPIKVFSASSLNFSRISNR